MTTLSLDHFLPEGRRDPAAIAAAIEVAGATRVALIAACAGVEDLRRTFVARGDDDGAKLLGKAALKLKGRTIEMFNTVTALQALDGAWTPRRDKALDARLEAMAADEGAKWMIARAADFLRIAMLEVRLAHLEEATAAWDPEVADVG